MQFLHNIQHRLLGNVLYKFSLIFCSLYVVLFFGKIEGTKILFYLFISMLLSIGIAGIGYAFNDIKDYKNDIQNNKQNLFINFSKTQSIFLVILFIICAVFPWFYLPFDRISFYLLTIEFALFFIYAFPPFRLKEKGIFGVIADSLYAQVVPCLLAVYTFSKLCNININLYFIALYTAWLFIVGIRNIINHQVEDFDNDTQTQTQTFVTKLGINFSKKLVLNWLLPIEWFVFLFILFMLPETYRLFFYLYLTYSFLYYFRKKIHEVLREYNDALYLNDAFYNFCNKNLLNEFYEIHLPLLLLIFFSYYDLFYVWVLGLNLLFFYPIYAQFVKGFFLKNFK